MWGYLGWLIRRLNPAINLFEQKKIEYYSSKTPKHQPIFIIGAPRTGSTILYQIITNEIKTLYIDNLVDLWHKNLFFGFYLSNKLFNQRTHNCFTSRHGNTFDSGLRAPSECGAFWYRWLPKEKHFVDLNEIPSQQINQLRDNIFSVINRFDLPFIFKNLNAGQRLRLISQIAPEAKFIFVKRNPLYTAQSIYKAKKSLNLKPDDWWSVKPYNYEDLLNLEGHEQIVKQIFFLEKQIVEDSKLFPEENFLTVYYENLMKDSEQTLEVIHEFIGAEYEKRKVNHSPELSFSETQTIGDEDFEKFKEEISKLDWRNYGYK